ncbi:unnamed protein product [Calypogeia fissa]
MGGEDAAALVQGLRDVFASGKTKSLEWRLEQLNGLVRMADERRHEVVAAQEEDLNKPPFETTTDEVFGVIRGASDAIANLKEWTAPEKVSHPLPYLADAEIKPEPLGVVLVISSWNYPFLLALEPVVGAIAAGNCVVLKPSKRAPASSALLAKLVPLYLDSSAVKVVEGGIPESTALLEQRWDKILLIGNARVGKIVMAAAAKHLTPVTFGLGGKSPTIIDSTVVDRSVVAKGVCRGKWACNNGQACIAVDYVLAEESIISELISKIKDILKEFYGEDASKSPDISRVVNGAQWERLTGLLKDESTAEKIVHGGQSDKNSLYIAPTIILDPSPDSPVMQEEIFGPILPIITVKNVDEAIRFVNSLPKPLALYLFTNDEKVQQQVLADTSSGGVTVNNTTAHMRHGGLPFGGVGDSGMGAYFGKHSFDTFSHRKAVLYQDLESVAAVSFPPYKQSKKLETRIVSLQDFWWLQRLCYHNFIRLRQLFPCSLSSSIDWRNSSVMISFGVNQRLLVCYGINQKCLGVKQRIAPFLFYDYFNTHV